ncbi:MAG: serine/threonine-protein kinase [Burkholderiaceae bacterium]
MQEFEIEDLLGEGGFSIVYRARDTQLGRSVALKEYLPASLALRSDGKFVTARSARHAVTFQLGLNSFINEAQLLASFDHPSLVKVYRFWEENGTAYMVMPLYEGQTLMDWLREHKARAGEAWLRGLLTPLLDALELMHASHCYHRDISPDNVLLLNPSAAGEGGVFAHDDVPRPVLLDFGAARRVIGNATQALTAILKPGYAPIEQYSETTRLRQGPWTDIYALCALLYHAVTGRNPMPSVGRLLHDELVPASTAAAGRCSTTFLNAIDLGLAVKPQDRPQSVRELRALFAGVALERTVILPVLSDTLDPTQPEVAAAEAPHAGDVQLSEARTLVQVKRLDAAPVEARSRGAAWASIAVASVAAIFVGAWYFSGSPSAPTPSAPDVPAVATPSNTANAPAAEPFSVLAGLNDIVQGADSEVQVDVRADKSTLRIGREPLRLRVRSSHDGYVYLYTGGTEKSHLYLLFPNRIDPNNRIKAGVELALPRRSWNITASGPPGVNQIVVMVSRSPRDLSGTGIKLSGGEIPEFDLQDAARRWERKESGSLNPFVGAVECRGKAARFDCAQGYGARMVEVVEVAHP